MNKVALVITVLLVLLVLLSSCKNEAIPPSEPLPDQTPVVEGQSEIFEETPETTQGLVIAEAVTTSRTGHEQRLIVRHVEGRVYEETEPGAFMGEIVEGSFLLELYGADGERIHTLDLNAAFGGGSLLFEKRRDFTIAFEDYNRDFDKDFTIGQYVSSNGFIYRLFTLRTDRIEALPVQGELFTADSVYSTAYDKVGYSSFVNRTYDQEQGRSVDTIYTWQDNQFVRTVCEDCQTLHQAAADKEIGELKLGIAQLEDGFRLMHFDQDEAYASNTLISPEFDGSRYVVHIVRRTYYSENEVVFRRDAVVVNPDTAEFQIYPMYQAVNTDMYKADSVASAYGFMDDRHLVYVAVDNDGGTPQHDVYRVVLLDIMTGEQKVVADALPHTEEDFHFAPGWLSEDGRKLVLNGFHSGRVWLVDLVDEKVELLDMKMAHAWPFSFTIVSPDGDRFWYRYELYDHTGQQIARVPHPEGHEQHPAFSWSPDGSYSATHDTWNDSDEHIIGENVDVYLIASQRIRFFDRDGSPVFEVRHEDETDQYVELAGWMDGKPNQVLLMEYKLDQSTSPKEKIAIQYVRLDIRTGEKKTLRVEQDFGRLQDAVPMRMTGHGERPAYWVDLAQGLLYISELPGIWLTESGLQEQALMSWDWDNYTAAVTYFDSSNRTLSVREVPWLDFEAVVVGQDWIVDRNMRYIRYQ